ncbi:hypothetical protein AVEN_139592-1 [Araneus ventricosus]|uniref:Uncharacterized protein n=1 Tax=Araneus ventricosus TaxID=182803 RepID=A0A4Y2U102_ARAVE|nr:hypothetical protein AVEN_139592-1 [Araneus ventricosus]
MTIKRDCSLRGRRKEISCQSDARAAEKEIRQSDIVEDCVDAHLWFDQALQTKALKKIVYPEEMLTSQSRSDKLHVSFVKFCENILPTSQPHSNTCRKYHWFRPAKWKLDTSKKNKGDQRIEIRSDVIFTDFIRRFSRSARNNLAFFGTAGFLISFNIQNDQRQTVHRWCVTALSF